MKEVFRLMFLIGLAFVGCMCFIFGILNNTIECTILGFVILFYCEYKNDKYEKNCK